MMEGLFNHLVLPPKLPGKQDNTEGELPQEFVKYLLKSVTTLASVAPPNYRDALSVLQQSLRVCGELNHGRLDRTTLLASFDGINKCPVALHVVEQNAAVIIRLDVSDVETVIFEAFEASPPSEKVLEAENALLWSFPGRAASIPLSTFQNPNFQESLADFLEKASMDALSRFTAKTRKAHVDVTEVRDSNDPGLITQMLFALLETLGSPIQVKLLRKRVRDDVNIDDSLIPWRRHPFWLIMRVFCQRQLCITMGDLDGRACYKMCITVLLAQFMLDAYGRLRPELTLLLRSKICRRLAKIEMDKEQEEDGGICHGLLHAVQPWLTSTIEMVSRQMSLVFDSFKAKTTRRIEKLPYRAPPDSLRLSLPSSGQYLNNLLHMRPAPQPVQTDTGFLQIRDEGILKLQHFTKTYYDLAQLQKDYENTLSTTAAYEKAHQNPASFCVEMSNGLCEYLDRGLAAYRGCPEQMSELILNVLIMWVDLDSLVLKADPKLEEYRPVFDPEIFDALQLAQASDLSRLATLQSYIQHRIDHAQRPDIFSTYESTDSYPFQCAHDSQTLQRIQETILSDCEEARDGKEAEFHHAMEACDDLTARIAGLSCLCLFGLDGKRTSEDIKNCQKCFLWRKRQRMGIRVLEEYLPDRSTDRAGVVFEIGIQRWFQAYRNATWRIVHDLTYPTKVPEGWTPLLLSDFTQLTPYLPDKSVSGGLIMASTQKSFTQTHFGELRVIHTTIEDVVVPFGPRFELYDLDHRIWVRELDRSAMTLQHLCGVFIPHCLRDVIPADARPPAVVEGPSSYQLIANQFACPPKASLHEFSAYQRLLLGHNQRWINILAELGSSNLNFSTSDTARLLVESSMQVGPSQDWSPKRAAFVVFDDESFCRRLAKQIEKRLHSIAPNFRESSCMELLITLTERLFTLPQPYVSRFSGTQASWKGTAKHMAHKLLVIARNTTFRWIVRLREEVIHSKDAETAERMAGYGFCAAILCRRTFALYTKPFAPEELSVYCEASISLQENITHYGQNDKIRMMLVRDTKMTWKIKEYVKAGLFKYPSALDRTISNMWATGDSSACPTKFSKWEELDDPPNWISSTYTTITKDFPIYMKLHFNYLEGYLLVNGKPQGRLPSKIRNDPAVIELFGSFHLKTIVSGHQGMSHQLATMVNGRQIHFGIRNDQVVIRYVSWKGTFELVPKSVFVKDGIVDFPYKLISGFTHWLNLSDRTLQMRTAGNFWTSKPLRWIINLRTRVCSRKGVNTVSRMVDPHSDIAQSVMRNFSHFEQPGRIMVTQTTTGRLTVELNGYDLLFYVNKNSNLEEPKLKFEVDPDQDAGALYGLKAQLVLRDTQNSSRRCVLVPLGQFSSQQAGVHVNVTLDPAANAPVAYARFDVNTVLSRLESSPDPPLMFALAHLHALTSFPLPDPLTSRTGTQEAIAILESGMAQPWEPFSRQSLAPTRLEWIAALAPSRGYYPRDLKRLGKSVFNTNLTMTISHDRLETLVRNIIEKSNRLEPFFHTLDVVEIVDPTTHLRNRAIIRRRVYEPTCMHVGATTVGDKTYRSRASEDNSSEAQNVVHIIKATFSRPLSLQLQQGLPALLAREKVIGGFLDEDGSPPSLSTLAENSVVSQFGTLVSFARTLDNLFGLAFRLGLLAFQDDKDAMDLLRVVIGFARLDCLKILPLPQHLVFIDYGVHDEPSSHILQQTLRPLWPEFSHRGRKQAEERSIWKCEEECRLLSRHFCTQWPAKRLSLDGLNSAFDMIDPTEALECVQEVWDRHLANRDLRKFVNDSQIVLESHMIPDGTKSPDLLHADSFRKSPSRTYFMTVPRDDSVIPSLGNELMRKSARSLGRLDPALLLEKTPNHAASANAPTAHLNELEEILRSFSRSKNILRQAYGQDLESSVKSFRIQAPDSMVTRLKLGSRTPAELMNRIQAVCNRENAQRELLTSCFAKGDGRYDWLQAAGLWPGTDKRQLLEQLRSSAQIDYGPGVKKALVDLGQIITVHQWLHRVLQATLRNEQSKLDECLANIGHENWNPYELPDWILIEIDGNFLIRRHQVEIARQIIEPASKSNSVMQLMMGEGKTSVIVPLAITQLANSKQLVRLVVPKALLLSTAQILQCRIGGLVGRPVRHLPFSRRSSTEPSMIRLYSRLHKEILYDYGVMLTTPDHVMSFKLSGLQRLVDSKGPQTKDGDSTTESARLMIKFAEELNMGCRDIIDESDLSLGVKTQLIYPSGPQLVVDGAPQRWEVIEQLLVLAAHHIPEIRRKFPKGLEIVRLQAGKGFPMIHFLQKSAEEELHRLLTDDIVFGRASFLRPAHSVEKSKELRQQIRVLLTEPSLKKLQQIRGGFNEAITLFADEESAPKVLMLVRGLLLNRILLLTLAKRYNVTYGLHPQRDPIAVPYDARGVPSEQAEFGHPDVSIILTVLSFFYGGLNLSQFRQVLEHVLKQSDDPAASFDRLTSTSDLPESLRHHYAINSDDAGQVNDLYRYLRFDRTCAITYLNTFVFPCFARQFAQKTSCSAWDIPLFQDDVPSDAQRARTSGFSGTNDNKSLLPLTISQDSALSPHTNAEVLSYLLQKRNRGYQQAADYGKRCTENGLLKKLVAMNCSVLIDAGAFILEMGNEELVRAWLDAHPCAKAAVYFKQGRPWVCYKGSSKNLPLVATPWSESINTEVLVFFDEAHCRGVDLRLPPNAQGVVTLALGQTKDHTVQAAMRLRQLATTQSVIFFAPPEVDAMLRDICRIPVNNRMTINSSHVIRFLLEQTCRANEQLQNLHIAQGMDFSRRMNAQWRFDKFLSHDAHRTKLLDVLQGEERQTLEQQYGSVRDISIRGTSKDVSFACLKRFMTTLAKERRHLDDSINGVRSTALEEVEQEREVEFQVEEVRQVAKPVKYHALKFPCLHQAIGTFVRTGRLEGDAGYMHAFESLRNTAIGKKFGVQGTGSRFFCSKEFSRTIALGKLTKTADNFLRPVEWILWSHATQTALIVIPEEAEILIPMIRRQGRGSAVCLLSYAAPVTKSMMDFNDLKFYALPTLPADCVFPAWFLMELGFFGGRLYASYDECTTIREYLYPFSGGEVQDPAERLPQGADCDGSTTERMETAVEKHEPFACNSVAFLLEWLALRRQVQEISQTPMGYVLQGRLTSKDHPFFANQVAPDDSPETSDTLARTRSCNETSANDLSDESDGGDAWSNHEDCSADEDLVDDVEEKTADNHLFDDVADAGNMVQGNEDDIGGGETRTAS